MISAMPSQYLCIFVSEIFRQAMTCPENATPILVNPLADLLLTNRGPLGYSALEFGSSLLKLLRKERPPPPVTVRTSFFAPNQIVSSPPKSVFAICNAIVCILRNANFAPQKYAIINHIIDRAFFPQQYKRRTAASRIQSLNIPPLQISDSKSLITVTLNSVEETQYRAVIWSVLFSMAEEPIPSTTLRLAFAEVPVKLIENVIRIIQSFESGMVLHSLIFRNAIKRVGPAA